MTKGEESRQRLIKCAAELFWKNGYSATGISQILRQTGLPKLSARTTGRNFAGCPYAVMGMETALSRPNITSAFMDARRVDTSVTECIPHRIPDVRLFRIRLFTKRIIQQLSVNTDIYFRPR